MGEDFMCTPLPKLPPPMMKLFDIPDDCDRDDDTPRLISKKLFITLTEYVLSLMPSERNVLVTMNEYSICSLHPEYNKLRKEDKDQPTHVIIFAFRIVNNDVFQPIGGTFVYDDFDVTDVVAECVKAFINDLWKLGLYVVGSVSPPSRTFKKILKHLVNIGDLDRYTGALSYSVYPFSDIIHVYDLDILERHLMLNFEKRTISFLQPNPEKGNESKMLVAAWADVLSALNANGDIERLKKMFNIEAVVPTDVNIFTKNMLLKLIELLNKGHDVVGTLVLVHCIYSFMAEVETDFATKKTSDWEWIMKNIRHVLSTMVFKRESSLGRVPEDIPVKDESNLPREDLKPVVPTNKTKTEHITNNESQNCDKDGNNNGLGQLVELKTLTESPFLQIFPSLLSGKCTVQINGEKMCIKKNKCEKTQCYSQIQNLLELIKIQKTYERIPVSEDLMCSIEGINILLEKFQKRRLGGAKVNLFNVEHLDDFVGLLKEKNGLLYIPKLKGTTYNLMHESSALLAMESAHSLYSISKVPLFEDNTEGEAAKKKKKRRPKAKNKEQNVDIKEEE